VCCEIWINSHCHRIFLYSTTYRELKSIKYFRSRAIGLNASRGWIFLSFQNCACCVKDLTDNKDNSLHLGRKYARIFVLGHYLFLAAHNFPRATLSENCSPLGTDNVRGQISENIFAPNGGYCLCIYEKIHMCAVVVDENEEWSSQ